MPTLRSKLIRLAHENPNLRGDLLEVLTAGQERMAEHRVTATSQDTKDFLTWVFLREARGEKKPLSDAEFRRTLKRLGVGIREKTPERKKGDLTKGEYIRPDKHKCKSEENMEACEQYHGEYGEVIEVSSSGVTVRFLKPRREDVEFEGKASGAKTGIYRSGSPESMEQLSKSIMVEVVYIKDKSAPPKVDKLRMEEVDSYLRKQEGRDARYYTGPVSMAAVNKAGQCYLAFKPQQRDGYANVNPSKGKMLYIGKMNKRPNFRQELEEWTWDPSDDELMEKFEEGLG